MTYCNNGYGCQETTNENVIESDRPNGCTGSEGYNTTDGWKIQFPIILHNTLHEEETANKMDRIAIG